MRKNVFGRQFKRDTNERKALFKSLISSLVLTGRIKTTETKAKAIRGDVDKIITKAKKGETARRILQSYLVREAVNKVISDIAPRFLGRQGGYSRITKMGRRLSDNAPMVLMEWVDNEIQNSKFKIQNLDKAESNVKDEEVVVRKTLAKKKPERSKKEIEK